MTSYYIEQDNQIVLFDEDKQRLQDTIAFMPQYKGLEIKETERPIVDFQFADTEEYKQEQAQKEAERIAMLNLTAADVERAIYKAKGIDFDDIVATLNSTQPSGIDIKALKIELKATNFYRGNPYVDAVGTLLGFTAEQLNRFFEAGSSDDTEIKANAYKYLTTVTLTINPTPVDAVVTINNVQGSTIALPYGTIAAYKIEKEGYLTHLGTVELTEDTSIDIELIEDVTEPEEPETPVEDAENEADSEDTETEQVEAKPTK